MSNVSSAVHDLQARPFRAEKLTAFYCPAGDFLAWDENLMAAGYRQIGDAWVYLIIAHEWGHAIQARLDRGRVSMAADDYPWTSQQDHGNARQRIGAFNTGASRGVGACA